MSTKTPLDYLLSTLQEDFNFNVNQVTYIRKFLLDIGLDNKLSLSKHIKVDTFKDLQTLQFKPLQLYIFEPAEFKSLCESSIQRSLNKSN